MRNVHSVGCEAAVDTVVEDPSGTAVQVETVGRRRFRLNRVVPSGTPYLMGDVTWLDDEPAPDARTLAAVDEALRGYLRILGLSAVTLDHHDPLLGYRVADAMLLSTADRQAVLAHRSSALQTVFGLLLREIFLIRELRAVPVTGQLSAVRAN
ncbi:MAG: hypothetical protein CSA58_07275 [Micrococcales bacterium]|nr:MAG: hypothetical protein CSA58_07275 [Micrococcales bacterium]